MQSALTVTCPRCGRRPENLCAWDEGEKTRGILIHSQRLAKARMIPVTPPVEIIMGETGEVVGWREIHDDV